MKLEAIATIYFMVDRFENAKMRNPESAKVRKCEKAKRRIGANSTT